MQRVAFILLVAFAALLGACSTVRLSYENADWLLARMAGRYVDLDAGQARVFKARLAQFHAWHRREELPQYARAFDEAADRLARGLSRQDVEWAVAEVRGRGRALGEQAGEELAPVLRALSDRQVADMQRALEQDDRDFVKAHLSGDPSRRAARRAAWLRDKLEDWVGPLTRTQQAQVDMFVAAHPGSVQLRLDERRRRQVVFLQLLRDHRSSPQFEALLSAFLADPAAGRSEANRQAAMELQDGFVSMLLGLDRSLTPRQRTTVVAKLRAYAAELRQLTGQQLAALN